MANNASYPLGPIAPSVCLNAVTVTPGATVYNPPLTKLWVGGTVAASIQLTMAQTGSVTLMNVPGGTMLEDIAILNVGTATTAVDLIGFF